MSTVMVPLDGSRFAEQALPLATMLARRMGTRMHLVRVRASLFELLLGDDSDNYMDEVAAVVESQLPDRVTHAVLTDNLGALNYPPPAPDIIAKVLADHASRMADLIVMATHGRGGLKRAWLGSIADALLRTAPRPVLLVRPSEADFSVAANAEPGIKHILVPLDGSEAAEEVIPVARHLAEPLGASITLLRVTSPLLGTLSKDPADGYPTAHPGSSERRFATQYLDRIATPLREGGLIAKVCVIEEFSPGAAIVDHARTHDVDLVALATRGAGSIRRLLLGSVADHVIRNCQTPVLACNAKHMEWHIGAGAPAAAEADLKW